MYARSFADFMSFNLLTFETIRKKIQLGGCFEQCKLIDYLQPGQKCYDNRTRNKQDTKKNLQDERNIKSLQDPLKYSLLT